MNFIISNSINMTGKNAQNAPKKQFLLVDVDY